MHRSQKMSWRHWIWNLNSHSFCMCSSILKTITGKRSISHSSKWEYLFTALGRKLECGGVCLKYFRLDWKMCMRIHHYQCICWSYQHVTVSFLMPQLSLSPPFSPSASASVLSWLFFLLPSLGSPSFFAGYHYKGVKLFCWILSHGSRG